MGIDAKLRGREKEAGNNVAEQQEHKGQNRGGTLVETLQRGLAGLLTTMGHMFGSWFDMRRNQASHAGCKSGKTEGRATYWQKRREWLRGGEEGKVASLLLYRKKWADRGEGGKALAFLMRIEDLVMIGLAEEGL